MKKDSFKIEYLEYYCVEGSSHSFVLGKKDLEPADYLEFAKEDFKYKDKRALVNSIGNAKRAFHFQVDILCDALGWGKIYGKKLLGFPKKLEFLGACGILSPNILKKLNKKRNEIEHDYYIPTEGEVEDYIDIVELFLMATQNFIKSFPDEVDYALDKDEELSSLGLPSDLTVRLPIGEGRVIIVFDDGKIEKTFKDEDFIVWLRSSLKQYLL